MKKLLLSIFLAGTIFTSNAQPGTLDPTFAGGSDFKEINFLEEQPEEMFRMVVDDQDRIWLAGYTYEINYEEDQTENSRIIIVRLTPDGEYDMSFGENGFAMLDLAFSEEVPREIALQGNSLIVSVQNGNELYMIRITEDGLLDESFGNSGLVELPSYDSHSHIIIVDESENIYASGAIFGNGIEDFSVVKFLSDGEIDSDFGVNGVASTPATENELPMSIELDENGNIYIFAIEGTYNNNNPCIIAFDPNGEALSSFSESGKKSIFWPGNLSYRLTDGIVSSDNQRLYVAGNVSWGENNEFGHAALTSVDFDGNLVQEFGDGGFVEVDVVDELADGIFSVIESAAGLYVGLAVVEHIEEEAIISPGVALFDHSGSLRQEFAESGSAFFNFTPYVWEWMYGGLAIQSDGRVILAGAAEENEEYSDTYGYVARLLPSSPLGVSEVNSDNFTLYPNPATQEIRIQSDGKSGLQEIYKIFNMQGQQVKSGRILSSNFAIDVSNLPQGAYQVLVGNESSRFLKVE